MHSSQIITKQAKTMVVIVIINTLFCVHLPTLCALHHLFLFSQCKDENVVTRLVVIREKMFDFGAKEDENLLLDCDTEFIRFSETIDTCTTFTNLENCPPDQQHAQYNADLNKFKIDQPIEEIKYTLSENQESRIPLQDILNVTGKFDANLFNKRFDEETQALLNSETNIEASPIEVEYEEVCEDLLRKSLNCRKIVKRPISTWFLQQLILNKTGINLKKKLEGWNEGKYHFSKQITMPNALKLETL